MQALKTAVHNDNCEVQFSGDQIREIIRLQGEANDVMSDAWRTSNNDAIPYYRAGWVEAAEALMHIGFKWWKNEHPTEESWKEAHGQAVMELVDVMHFSASDIARLLGDQKISDDDVEVFYPPIYNIGRFADRRANETDVNPVTYSELTFQDLCEQMVYSYLRDGRCHWTYINVMAEALEVTADQLFATYIGKNTLNKFRTANGQREGTYNKIWDGQEDNIYLTERIEELQELERPVIQDDLMEYLDGMYKGFQERGVTERA